MSRTLDIPRDCEGAATGRVGVLDTRPVVRRNHDLGLHADHPRDYCTDCVFFVALGDDR